MTTAPLRKVVGTMYQDNVVRVELLECGHKKTTVTGSERNAYRRRCFKCDPLLVAPK